MNAISLNYHITMDSMDSCLLLFLSNLLSIHIFTHTIHEYILKKA